MIDYNDIEAREARSVSHLFLVFQGKKASSYRMACKGRVPCINLFVCMCERCVRGCLWESTFFRPRLSTALNAHGTKASSDESGARTILLC